MTQAWLVHGSSMAHGWPLPSSVHGPFMVQAWREHGLFFPVVRTLMFGEVDDLDVPFSVHLVPLDEPPFLEPVQEFTDVRSVEG